MFEIGRAANDEFVSRNLGPREPLDVYMDMNERGELEPESDDVARWKAAHALGEGNPPRPWGTPEYDAAGLEKLRKSQQKPHEETLAEWKARTDYAADRAQEAIRDHHVDVLHEAAEGDESDDPPRWVNERIAEGYTMPGGFLARSAAIVKARLLAKTQSGLSRESAVAELSEEHSEIIVKISAAMLDGKTFEQAKALVEV